MRNLAQIFPSGWDPANLQIDPNNPTNDPIFQLISRIANLALLLGGSIAVLFIIVSAIMYFTAYGNEERATQAKKTLIWAIAGTAFILISYFVVNLVWSFMTPDTLYSP